MNCHCNKNEMSLNSKNSAEIENNSSIVWEFDPNYYNCAHDTIIQKIWGSMYILFPKNDKILNVAR